MADGPRGSVSTSESAAEGVTEGVTITKTGEQGEKARGGQAPPAVPPPQHASLMSVPDAGGGRAEPGHAEARV
jgi:hypothetical protein